MLQAIADFTRDEQGHWIAVLACGHSRHMRHQPPWEDREWVTTEAGRLQKIGLMLDCNQCDQGKT